MIEFVQHLVQAFELEHGDLVAALWLGVGLIVGLVLACASIAALAIECMRDEQSHL